MSKQQLIDNMATSLGTSKAEAERQVDNTFKSLKDELQSDGDKIVIRGFGTFSRKYRAGRTGRNPRTGETMQIAGRSVLTFKPGKDV